MRLRLIFDLDGTLVESAGSLAAAANALLGELERPPLEVERVRAFIGHGMDMLVDRVLRATGGVPEQGVAACIARFHAIYSADPVSGVTVFPGVHEALAGLAAAGHGLAVCTQKPEVPARRVLDSVGLIPPVTGLTGGDSAGALKPDPAMIHHAAAQLLPGPVVFVGDSEVDAETARNARVPFVLRLGGYRHGPLSAIPRHAEFAEFDELSDIVARLET